MAINASAWLRDARSVYLDNATSRRDYRVQLRGNKSVVLFGTYLFLLIGAAMLVYTNTVHANEQEVVEAQRSLRDFYLDVTWMLGALVSLVAPALTATTVVTERQRKSLDLVFSAPVSPRYFLVGKMMSSFRYTWMLLVLALPVTAVCVVLGGASWADVLLTYVLLSFQGLVMTSIGLLLSTIAQKPVSAVLWSYAASIVYLWVTAMLSFGYMSMSSFPSGSPALEQPFFVALNPFSNQQTVGTYSVVMGHQIPNWILVGLFAILMSKICLLGGGVMLSPRPEKEIASLRVHAIVYIAALIGYGSAIANEAISTYGGPDSAGRAHFAGATFFCLMSPLFVIMPFISCFGVDGERRFWPDGIFSLRHTLDGRPSGGLPFLLTFIGATALALLGGVWYAGPKTTTLAGVDAVSFSYSPFGTFVFYTMAFWAVFWAIGRFTSSFFMGLRAARTLQFSAFILLVALPVPFLAAVSGYSPDSNESAVWDVFPLRPLFVSSPDSERLALMWAIGMTVLALVVAASAEIRTRGKLALLKAKYDVLSTS